MNNQQRKDTDYLIECLKRNTEEIINQKPSKSQLVSFIKQKGMSIYMGDDSTQNVIDICTALFAYKVLHNK